MKRVLLIALVIIQTVHFSYGQFGILLGGFSASEIAFSLTVQVEDQHLTLPTKAGATYDCIVDWGDGSEPSVITSHDDPDRSHTYVEGVYTIEITGIYTNFDVLGTTFAQNIQQINSFGAVGLTYINFRDAVNLQGSLPIFPESLTSISGYCFLNCNNLNGSLYMPNTILDVGLYAFYNTGFTSVHFSNNITIIEQGTFQNCTAINSEIVIPEYVTSIGNNAFNGCVNVPSVSLPNGLVSIGNYAFRDCHSLEEISLPSSLTSLGISAYYNCSNAEGQIIVPSSITSIPSWCFYNTNKITGVTFPTSLVTISDHCFYSSGITSLTIPASVTTIGVSAFQDCQSIEVVNMYPNTAPIADSYAFLLGRDPIPLHVPIINTGYDVEPWITTSIFTPILEDL